MIMPTRKRGAVVIRGANDRYSGVFNFDGCSPTMFGNQVWERLQDNWNCLWEWSNKLLKYGYWEEFINDGRCQYCGKIGVGQPSKVGLGLLVAVNNGNMPPDPNAAQHSHYPTMPTVISDNAKTDGLFIEWIYIVDPQTYTLEVLRSIRAEGFTPMDKGGKKWSQPNYGYFPVGLYSLHGKEPDWAYIEQRGLQISSFHWDKFRPCQRV